MAELQIEKSTVITQLEAPCLSSVQMDLSYEQRWGWHCSRGTACKLPKGATFN